LLPFASGGQTTAIAGQATGLVGSQVGVGLGTHWPAHFRPLHAPLASHTHEVSVASQAHAAGGVVPVAGSVAPGVPPPVPPGKHPHS
jgi:hypothetical protein